MKGRKNSFTRASLALGATVTSGAAIAGGAWVSHAFAQGRAAGPFTAARAQSGQAESTRTCAACHARAGAPLFGSDFMTRWGNRTTQELYTRIKDTMPIDNAGSLSADQAASIVAAILQTNG